ncbi:MAG: hypothetical protein IT200_02340 [Thermoleophilia bacterium]|nr:hypothetical protein [Thermoleophilia bacterium]
MAQGGVLTGGDPRAAPSPDALLAELRAAAGDPPLPPLRIAEPVPSARVGLPGRVVSTLRRQVLRLISPALGELLAELERDRHRQRAEIAALRTRLDELERRDGVSGGG